MVAVVAVVKLPKIELHDRRFSGHSSTSPQLTRKTVVLGTLGVLVCPEQPPAILIVSAPSLHSTTL